MTCPCCGKLLNVFIQPALLPGRPERQLAECRTPDCQRAWITLSPDELRTLTPTQIQGYAAAEARLHARLAETAGVG